MRGFSLFQCLLVSAAAVQLRGTVKNRVYRAKGLASEAEGVENGGDSASASASMLETGTTTGNQTSGMASCPVSVHKTNADYGTFSWMDVDGTVYDLVLFV